MKNKKLSIIALILSLILSLSACGTSTPGFHGQDVPIDHTYETDPTPSQGVTIQSPSDDEPSAEIILPSYNPSQNTNVPEVPSTNETTNTSNTNLVEQSLHIPAYSGSPYVVVNNNNPFFESNEITTNVFETYSEHDNLGRCGVAYANICKELMPTDKRESISSVKPSGWNNKPYDFVDGGYIYNRCHLIGFQLAGENANDKNLITGTRYMNVDGMLPFENMIDDYVDETNNHVLYRVTPMYEGNNLVASGVLMEAYSVEDDGDGICFNVYCYNVQPGCEINYANGDNWLSSKPVPSNTNTTTNGNSTSSQGTRYIINKNTKKFHLPTCSNAQSMSENNKGEYIGTREDMINQGYSPCGICKP